MKLSVLYSGGKDSNYSMYLVDKLGYEISCLISVFPENEESYMFHYPNVEMVKFQARAMEKPLVFERIEGKENEVMELEKVVEKARRKYKFNGIISGAIESVYQAERIQKICNNLNLFCINPLWQINPYEYMKDLIRNFEVIITGIFSYKLDENFLGRRIDENILNKFILLNKKYGMHISGEGGEYETFVLNSPLFKKRIVISDFEKIMDKNSGILKIKEIKLVEK